MQNRIKITSGSYKAETEVVLALFQGNREIEYSVVKPGSDFSVPQTVNGFGYFATYYPDFGDKAPKFAKV